MSKKTIKDIDLKGKKVFVRCDFNVPMDENKNITDNRRIVAALPTIKYLIDDGVKSRGHRKNIMNKDFKTTGVGFANKHKLYGCECVLDYAGEYTEKE